MATSYQQRLSSPDVHVRSAEPKPSSKPLFGFLSFVGNTPAPIALLICVALLVGTGLISVYVAVQSDADYSFMRQVLGVGVGLVGMAAFWVFDYRRFSRMTIPLLVVVVALILLPYIPGLGTSVNGAQSWVKIGTLQFQPSEFAKPLAILMIAAGTARYEGSIEKGGDYLKVFALTILPFVLLAREDLGSALVILVLGFVILFVGGVARRWLLITIFGLILLLAALLFASGLVSSWTGGSVQIIKPYQMSRLLVFIDPDNPDYSEDAYNLNQAKIAVGSGEIAGKGFGNATQSSGGFLPEAATDFIFCSFAEQYGFLGCFALLAVYLALLAAALSIGFKSSDLFGTLIVAGVMGMWLFQIVENIGMDLGLMPITGIPLPFMSYGSSFMLTNFICVGLLCSIWFRREDTATFGSKGQGKAGQLHV